MFLVCISIIDQNLYFLIGRDRLSILFHCCRFCFQILIEETFSMLFNLSRCSSARTFAISMQLLPYFSYSCINLLCSSSIYLPLFILLFSKLDAAALSSKILFFFGGRDSWYFWCATASSSTIWAFFSRGRDSRYF